MMSMLSFYVGKCKARWSVGLFRFGKRLMSKVIKMVVISR